MIQKLKSLGPGLLFAGASIGVSHLVMSTRAGAEYGFGLVWALLLVHLFKYPFFQYGPRYAMATGESLVDGYKKLGKGVLITYFILAICTMFTIQSAVTIVTAGLAINLFGLTENPVTWSLVITIVIVLILLIGRYKLLDNLMKVIIVILTITTITSVIAALLGSETTYSFMQILPEGSLEIGFLIAFLGWMPSPLDLSVIHSLWALEKKKDSPEFSTEKSISDFNIGYVFTIILGLCFLSLGVLVMYGTGESFSSSAGGFAQQLIALYTNAIGDWMYLIIAIAAFTTMFSTTLTTMDASPRALSSVVSLLSKNTIKKSYWFWISLLSIGTIFILNYLKSEMGTIVKIATILSFLSAPFFAISNFVLISGKHTPKEWRPSLSMKILSYFGILFLIGFSVWYLMNL
ncbi:MAG: Nramp family divalent metal transporter [Urechidicola sp.]|nr:Nramp family divalent metal transporter [Urechidicola sp.]